MPEGASLYVALATIVIPVAISMLAAPDTSPIGRLVSKLRRRKTKTPLDDIALPASHYMRLQRKRYRMAKRERVFAQALAVYATIATGWLFATDRWAWADATIWPLAGLSLLGMLAMAIWTIGAWIQERIRIHRNRRDGEYH